VSRPYIWPDDKDRAERRRLREQEERIVKVKTALLIAGVVLGLLAAGACLLYLAVRLVRLAWGS